ncbi:expressed unknown protein [Seminavis robusta]|uniref:Uncharacterized protein n=1 Tax=Seminavis robusta TaxID=568900 RepID=A0A9N8HU03_9STRA|nr:expressed unknown protein [Seminavis robusta]|eukprot:Sro1673_g290250.1 n/a (243) ;mRNA; f:13944-14672
MATAATISVAFHHDAITKPTGLASGTHATMTATIITSNNNKRTMECYEDLSNRNKKRCKMIAKKRVHFSDFDEDDTPREQVHIVPRVSAEDAPAVWYTLREMQQGRQQDSHWLKFFSCYKQPRDAYKQQLFQVLGTACGAVPEDMRVNAELANSPVRGLEREMAPCFRQRKRQVIANVLESQRALREWHQSNNNTDNKDMIDMKGAELMAAHYQKLTLPAVRFAQLLAQGDAQVAQRLDNQH